MECHDCYGTVALLEAILGNPQDKEETDG